MEFVVGILLLLTFFGLAYYCIKGHNLMIGFLIITILWTALSFLGAAFASPEFLSTTAFYSNGEPVKAIAILNKIYQSAPEGWGTTLVNVCWGAWFGRVLMETGIASTLIRKTVELGGDRPIITIVLLNVVTAFIFTAMMGAGPVIAIGVIVLPIMMSVPLFAVVYKFVGKHMPDMLSTVFTPILSLLATSPFILCLLAPFGTIVGNAISGGLAWFGMNTGFFGVGVIAALWEFLVMSGMHLALMMPMMASFFETGEMTGVMLAGSFATWACFGVALGAALRLKGKAERGNAFGAFVSGILGGVTEPVLYGICLSHVRCFGALMVGSFVGGAYAGIVNLTQYVITSANFLSVLSYVGGTNVNFIQGIIASLISLVVAAVCTYLFGFSKKELDQANAK